ncbi:Hsp70 family protein [Thermomonospora cellulosilytica]|uniref:Molecular chaperone DnaK n=1 Tax=Thermomonospora cellulosilytica TaxID=1411118 RepID=A0A7W3MTI1_9ACTN|nr:Hsp70 family protein [Thermomonospora cellulosilytica]MBA9001584.1 molecular chaperone DnaK [Thermomonospora cellulosilytica]
MTRSTIDFGIDLGTTNSAIARFAGVGAEIVKNNLGHETTPSAVWVDRRNRMHVGSAAKVRSEEDPDNVCTEFKLRMGTSGMAKHFTAAGRSMEPEEMSAEVLKSLKRDVAQRHGEEITAAVITVPAAFELSACDATKRAAELAGLTQAPLLQEPIAAALASGFQSTADNAFWLVYDLGGGTFDAAVINLRDGEFNVVTHRGDNFLGGKLIDWQIVERLLIPAITERHAMTGLGRGDRRWAAAISKLKQAAEQAKIQLSQMEVAEVLLELTDEHGRPFDFEYEMHRADVERLFEPFIVRSVNLCRTALSESGLGPGDIEKVLLVGGPTLSPYLRQRLADPREGLGIPLDHGQDPITVVARGAAIFAATQRLETMAAPPPPAPGQYAVQLEYEPVGPDLQPFVGGRVSGPDLAGYSVELIRDDARDPWRSGRIALAPNGAFGVTLLAERGRPNTYRIELTDPTGAPHDITPATLTYTVGVVDTQPPLTHSIGVGLADNEVEWLLKRGTPLPAKRRVTLRTTVPVRAGGGEGMIRIPLLEGEHDRADRNRRIGRLEVSPTQVRRDVPEGSEVEVTLRVDESRLIVARAYMPILDEEFEQVVNLQTETVPEQPELAREAAAEKRRLAAARREAEELNDRPALTVLARIDAERIVADVEEMVEAAKVDPDAATMCGKRLLDLKAAVDEVEDALEWPRLTLQAHELLQAVREIVAVKGGPQHRQALASGETAVQEAITAHNARLLQQRLDELRSLALQVLDESGDLQFMAFEELRTMQPEMRDQAEAGRLIAVGRQAMDRGDADTLRHINVQLRDMLPSPPPPPDPFSTVRR